VRAAGKKLTHCVVGGSAPGNYRLPTRPSPWRRKRWPSTSPLSRSTCPRKNRIRRRFQAAHTVPAGLSTPGSIFAQQKLMTTTLSDSPRPFFLVHGNKYAGGNCASHHASCPPPIQRRQVLSRTLGVPARQRVRPTAKGSAASSPSAPAPEQYAASVRRTACEGKAISQMLKLDHFQLTSPTPACGYLAAPKRAPCRGSTSQTESDISAHCHTAPKNKRNSCWNNKSQLATFAATMVAGGVPQSWPNGNRMRTLLGGVSRPRDRS